MDQDRIYDIRTLDRNLEKGLISKKDYDKFLKGLDDVEENLEIVAAQLEGDSEEE